MSAKPVAWPIMADGKTSLLDYLEGHTKQDECGDEWTKGYEACKQRLFEIIGPQLRNASPPAQARALAIQECARAVHALYKKDAKWLSPYEEGCNDGIDNAEQEIRALSSAPSVTEEWVNQRVLSVIGAAYIGENERIYESRESVRATLAALGVEVK